MWRGRVGGVIVNATGREERDKAVKYGVRDFGAAFAFCICLR